MFCAKKILTFVLTLYFSSCCLTSWPKEEHFVQTFNDYGEEVKLYKAVKSSVVIGSFGDIKFVDQNGDRHHLIDNYSHWVESD